MGYSIADIVAATQGTLEGTGANLVITDLVLDSRKASAPDQSLFIAIQGGNHDGHAYIDDLYHQGFRVFMVHQSYQKFYHYAEATFIVVPDTLIALQRLVTFHRSKFKLPIIAITGSNGKTVLKEWLYQCLSPDCQIVRSPRSYNSQVGVPLSLWQIDAEHELGLIEAGISQPGEMARLRTMIQPSEGVLTHIGAAHDEGFRDLTEKVNEKLQLFKGVKKLYYSLDTPVAPQILATDAKFDPIEKLTWSVHKSQADLWIKQVDLQKDFTTIRAQFKGKELSFEIPFLDQASLHNVYHLILILLDRDMAVEVIQSRIKKLSAIDMRMDLKQGIYNTSIINDAYSADLSSLHLAMDFLHIQHQHEKRALILSDIYQTGKNPLTLYAEIKELVKRHKIDIFIGIGGEIQKVGAIPDCNTHFYPSTEAFMQGFNLRQLSNTTILIKGARTFGFERIVRVLELKSHETNLEINLNSLAHNLNYFRTLVKPSTGLIAMVKALSYGSGTYEIANLLEYHRVSYLAVAYIDEGVALRKAGIRMPIIVMNPSLAGMDAMIKYNLEPEIYNKRTLDAYATAVRQSFFRDRAENPIHIKFNTGMNRLGFDAGDVAQLVADLKQYSALKVHTAYTHLVASENPEMDDFTAGQMSQFHDMVNEMADGIGYQPKLHALNSSGVQRHTQHQLDYVRVGIGLYGIDQTGEDDLQHVSTLKSTISQVRTVKKGQSVGYGGKAKVSRDSSIATVAIGYADGLSRALGNGKGKMIVGGQAAPIVGNVCMDMTMIDVTGLPAMEGDEVEVFGNQYTVSQMAEDAGTIPYEILTSVSHRVKRVFFHE